MNIVVAIDSFKGSASSNELSLYIKRGMKKVDSKVKVQIVPVADGGEGTVEAFAHKKGAKQQEVTCKDPLGKDVKALYTMLSNGTAVIEMAAASGLPLVPYDERNPWLASSYGTGELILDAFNKGAKEFIIGIGGSATNDMGLGMLRAFGFKFYDDYKEEVTQTKGIPSIVRIDSSHVKKEFTECKFLIACDVNNPLYGKNGASYVFGAQKGGGKETIEAMDKAHRSFANVVKEYVGEDFAKVPGVGAAGGLGFAFLAFLNAKLDSGIKIVLEQQNFSKKIQKADLVITGEGSIDAQSSMGKVLDGIASYCKEVKVPCIALCGGCKEFTKDIHKKGITGVFSIMDSPMSLEEAMDTEKTLELIEKKSEQLFRLIKAYS